jgi:hypothetical protein
MANTLLLIFCPKKTPQILTKQPTQYPFAAIQRNQTQIEDFCAKRLVYLGGLEF